MFKSISEVRVENVNRLLESHDMTKAQFAEKIETNGSQVSQYFSGKKIIGDSVAARIEQCFNLPRYWLDKDRIGNSMVKAVRHAPVLTWVRAGLFHETGELQYDETEPVYDEDYPEGIYWLTVKGDSMEPRFHKGDLILIDPNRTAKAGDYVIAIRLDVDGSYENAMTFKKYRQGFDEKMGRDYSQLVPLNEDYAVIDSRHTPFEVRGVVLERKEKFV